MRIRLDLCLLASMLSMGAAGTASDAKVPSVIGYPQAVARFRTLPAHGVDLAGLQAASDAQKTLPLWSAFTRYGSQLFLYTMVGVNPTTGGSATVPVEVFALRFVFSDGSVFDPTQGACGDRVSVLNRMQHSPLFDAMDISSNGVDVGTTQYEDAFERAEFWSLVSGTGYHILIKSRQNPIQLYSVVVPRGRGQTYSGKNCAGKFGVVDAGWLAHRILTPLSRSWRPRVFELAFMYDVFQSDDGKIDQCCILGYHGAYGNPMQTYGTATYNDAKIFNAPIEDISPLSHELGEWINDPTGANPTPAWGHVGQVLGCQSNLEVGDPLTGTLFGPLRLHGFSYHPQELAFFSWFYRQRPSIGTGGLYSLGGTFTAPQGPCK